MEFKQQLILRTVDYTDICTFHVFNPNHMGEIFNKFIVFITEIIYFSITISIYQINKKTKIKMKNLLNKLSIQFFFIYLIL